MIAFDCIGKLGFVMRILAKVIYYVRILVPIILIVLIVFDLFKALTGGVDDKAKKEAGNKAVKRLMYAALVFLVPTIINIIFLSLNKNIVADNNGGPTDWIGCWTYYYNE